MTKKPMFIDSKGKKWYGVEGKPIRCLLCGRPGGTLRHFKDGYAHQYCVEKAALIQNLRLIARRTK